VDLIEERKVEITWRKDVSGIAAQDDTPHGPFVALSCGKAKRTRAKDLDAIGWKVDVFV
jgi:hypothetical protein